MEITLRDKVAIVTGASRGIGAATAKVLASTGADPVLAARDGKSMESVADEIAAETGRRPLVCPADLAAEGSCEALVEEVVKQKGRIDIVVNIAGATKRGDFMELSHADYLDGFALKFHAAVRLCRAAWPHLTSAKGSVVNIIGSSSRTPTADFTIGGPVNSALLNFTKGLAERGLSDGVQVNAINPGHIKTDRLLRRIETLQKAEGISAEVAEERMRVDHGIARFGRPEEIGTVIAFLCSDLASYIHGTTIDVDGGTTRGI